MGTSFLLNASDFLYKVFIASRGSIDELSLSFHFVHRIHRLGSFIFLVIVVVVFASNMYVVAIYLGQLSLSWRISVAPRPALIQSHNSVFIPVLFVRRNLTDEPPGYHGNGVGEHPALLLPRRHQSSPGFPCQSTPEMHDDEDSLVDTSYQEILMENKCSRRSPSRTYRFLPCP